MVFDRDETRFAVVEYDKIAHKLEEPIQSNETMHEYLMRLVEDLGLEWIGIEQLNTVMKVRR